MSGIPVHGPDLSKMQGRAEIYEHEGTYKIDITLDDQYGQHIYDLMELGYEIEGVTIMARPAKDYVKGVGNATD